MSVKSYSLINIQDEATGTLIVLASAKEGTVFTLYGKIDEATGLCHLEHQYVVDTPEQYAELWEFLKGKEERCCPLSGAKDCITCEKNPCPLGTDEEEETVEPNRELWENHILRRLLIVHGADMDKVSKMTNNEAWMKELTQ